MSDVIAFYGDNGVSIMFPAPDSGLTIKETAERDIPNGEKYLIIDFEDLPQGIPQSTWKIDFDNGKVSADVDKVTQMYGHKALEKKNALIDEANVEINSNNWPTKLTLGRLKDEEKIKLNAWLDYIDLLEDTDLSDAPDVQWPKKPTV